MTETTATVPTAVIDPVAIADQERVTRLRGELLDAKREPATANNLSNVVRLDVWLRLSGALAREGVLAMVDVASAYLQADRDGGSTDPLVVALTTYRRHAAARFIRTMSDRIVAAVESADADGRRLLVEALIGA